MTLRRHVFLIVLILVVSPCARAQKNELSFSVGAMHSSDQKESILGITCPVGIINCNQISSTTDNSVALEGAYARQLASLGPASLGFELPIVVAPGRDVNISALSLAALGAAGSLSTSSLFFTPSVRIKLFRSGPISPFASVGGGLAHFGSNLNVATVAFGPVVVPGISASNSTNHGALQFGGGVDVKTPLPHLSLRAEVRDFWTIGIAQNSSVVQVSPERQHNIFASGGVVLRF